MDTPLSGLLQAAWVKRENLRAFTNAIRIVNGYGDGLDGLVLEQHDQHFVAQVFEERWLDEQEALVHFVRGLGAKYFVIKDRTQSASSRAEDLLTRVWIDGLSSTMVEEHGVKFSVDMKDTLNTGLFLDMRANRRRVASLAKARKVLNLFAYTCAFGLHCRKQGAASVVNVDVSRKALDRARVNYELNGVLPEKNEFIRADAVEYLERGVKKDNRFNMIILDPPSFARFEGKTFVVKKDLPQVVALCIKLLEPDGVLFVATNHSEMIHSHLQSIIKTAAKGRKVNDIQCLGQDTDFEGSGFMAESCLTAVLARL